MDKLYENVEKYANDYINKFILKSEPLSPLWNRENFLFKKIPKWNYADSCIIRALIMLYELDSDGRLVDFAKKFTDAYVDQNGEIPTVKYSDFNLDNINGCRNLIWLFRETGQLKYKTAYENLFNYQLLRQPRLKCGNFSHKAIYPNQVWLDGVYMAFPFMAEYSLLSGNDGILDDIDSQLKNIQRIMRDEKTGLYYHGYDESRLTDWSDKKTGLSKEFWLRSIGWLCAGLADLCEIVPKLEISQKMLKELLSSLRNFLTPENMLLQLPTRGELQKNYPETSGTLLFAYSAMKSNRLGITKDEFFQDGKNALLSVTENYMDCLPDGTPVLKNICLMGGLGMGRDGTAEYYLSETITENDAKGIAPFLMAYSELKRKFR